MTGMVTTMLNKSRGPRCENDVQVLNKLLLSIATESKSYDDSTYTDYQIEDDRIHLLS